MGFEQPLSFLTGAVSFLLLSLAGRVDIFPSRLHTFMTAGRIFELTEEIGHKEVLTDICAVYRPHPYKLNTVNDRKIEKSL